MAAIRHLAELVEALNWAKSEGLVTLEAGGISDLGTVELTEEGGVSPNPIFFRYGHFEVARPRGRA